MKALLKNVATIAVVLNLTSCTISETNTTTVFGCTDPNARNYDNSAGIDDGSCVYVNRFIFYTDGAYINSNESFEGVRIKNANNNSNDRFLRSAYTSDVSSLQCSNINSSDNFFVVDLRNDESGTYEITYFKYDVNYDFIETVRTVVLSSSEKGSCSFYKLSP